MKARFTTWSDTVASRCRWSEYAAELFESWDIIWDNSSDDYQGSVQFLAHKDGKFGYLHYSYGSCSGCDGFEDRPIKDVREEFKNMAEYFDDVHQLQRWVDLVNYGEEFQQAVSEYVFHAQLEKKLEENSDGL
jgi:hypothetical protein